jgi:hypothetical protein
VGAGQSLAVAEKRQDPVGFGVGVRSPTLAEELVSASLLEARRSGGV